MAIDYTLELACEPKRAFGLEGLSDRLRRLERLQNQLALDPEQAGPVREVVFELRPLAFHCAKCPANHRAREFGCFGRVDTPLSAEAEEWLMDLLPASLKVPETAPADVRDQAARLQDLIAKLNELEVPLAVLEDRRAVPDGGEEEDPPPLLEASKSTVRTYGRMFRRSRISSDQILDLLLLHPSVPPATAELVCRALGVWQQGGVGEDGVPEMVFTQPIEGDDDPTVAQLKLLFYALMIACSLNIAVTTEVSAEA